MLFVTLFATITALFQILTSMTISHVDMGEKLLLRRRRLVFPTGTVLQMTVGVSTPVNVPNRTVLLSLGIQMIFGLPTNATVFFTSPDIMTRREISSKVLQRIYLPLESFLEKHGFDGRTCVLRSICEVANSPFQQEEMNFLEEMVHAVLTPSQEVQPEEGFCSNNTRILESLPLEKKYLAAECLGRTEGDCHIAYSDCPQSPLDFISKEFNVD